MRKTLFRKPIFRWIIQVREIYGSNSVEDKTDSQIETEKLFKTHRKRGQETAIVRKKGECGRVEAKRNEKEEEGECSDVA